MRRTVATLETQRLYLVAWPRGSECSLFDAFPELHSIWQPELAAIAAKHTTAWECDTNETGNVFIAYVGGEVVGVTGWYRMSSSEAGLRWHGVLPHARRRGLSTQMLSLVCADMPQEIRHVFEATRNRHSMLAFQASGFKEVTDPNVIRRAVIHAEYEIGRSGFLLCKTMTTTTDSGQVSPQPTRKHLSGKARRRRLGTALYSQVA